MAVPVLAATAAVKVTGCPAGTGFTEVDRLVVVTDGRLDAGRDGDRVSVQRDRGGAGEHPAVHGRPPW